MARTVYEIVNPSDPYTLVAEDHELAAIACFALGSGMYALKPVEGDLPEVGIWPFGGAADWFMETFGRDFAEAVAARRDDIATCLDSVLIGTKADRAKYERALSFMPDEDDRQKWRAEWHEENRSSLNDIGRRAKDIAEHLRATKAA